MKFTLIAIVALMFSGLTFAQITPKKKPCKSIMEACKSAGFVKHGHKENKGIKKDCMQPLLDGGQVPGVTVAAEDIEACKVLQAKSALNKKQAKEKKVESKTSP